LLPKALALALSRGRAMMWLWEQAEKLGALAQLALTITAVGALGFAYLQIRGAQRSQREATARDVYRDYLRLAFEHPTLATPEGGRKIIQNDKYRWFVAITLNACEEIHEVFEDDDTWREVILAEMEYHVPYLKSKFFLADDEDRGWKLYSDDLRILFEERFPSPRVLTTT